MTLLVTMEKCPEAEAVMQCFSNVFEQTISIEYDNVGDQVLYMHEHGLKFLLSFEK